VIIKVLFVVLVLSAAVLIGVAIAVYVRVWRHLKSRRAKVMDSADVALDSKQEDLS
jgi:phage shock protein PspC (stress-responsive transcriptional regulator)